MTIPGLWFRGVLHLRKQISDVKTFDAAKAFDSAENSRRNGISLLKDPTVLRRLGDTQRYARARTSQRRRAS